ncbi:Molecular chaperone, DnaJ family protein, partial [Giardia duodenalis]
VGSKFTILCLVLQFTVPFSETFLHIMRADSSSAYR